MELRRFLPLRYLTLHEVPSPEIFRVMKKLIAEIIRTITVIAIPIAAA